jgi:hypothetical protein
MQDPEYAQRRIEQTKRAAREFRENYPERYAELARGQLKRRLERIRNDPEYRERHLQHQREWEREHRLKLGLPVMERYPGVTNAVVPIGPFRDWLRAVVELEPVPEIGGNILGSDGRRALASRLGTTNRSINRLLNDGQKYVSVRLADRAVLGYAKTIRVNGKLIASFDDLYSHKVPLEIKPDQAERVFGDSFTGEVNP